MNETAMPQTNTTETASTDANISTPNASEMTAAQANISETNMSLAESAEVNETTDTAKDDAIRANAAAMMLPAPAPDTSAIPGTPDKLKPLNPNVEATELTLESFSSDPRVVAALIDTAVGAETPVIQTQEGFVRFLVRAKSGESKLPFEQVKNAILQHLSSDRENTILKEYFEGLKSRATITIIRLP
jgi:hypothetical protein